MWKYGGFGKYLAYGAALALPFLEGGCTTAERAEKTYPISQRGIDVLVGLPIYTQTSSVRMRLETLKILRTNPERAEDHIIACLKNDLEFFGLLRKTYNVGGVEVSEPEKKELDREIDECERNIHKALTEK